MGTFFWAPIPVSWYEIRSECGPERLQKMRSFFFRELQLVTVLLLIRDLWAEGQGSSFRLSKNVCGIFHFDFVSFLLKAHYCRFENLPICLRSYKNNTLKISRSES